MYTKTTWATGDIITAAKLNNLETQYDEAKADLDAHEAAADPHPQYATDTDLSAHTGNISNPHGVTAAQAGAETPSGAQAKVDAHGNLTNNPHNVTAAQAGAEPAFTKNSGFNKNLGTAAGTVSEGNHNHNAAYLGISAKAADSDTIDGKHASDFAATAYGTWNDSTTSMGPLTFYTKRIPLGINAKRGRLVAKNTNSYPTRGVTVLFDTNSANGIGFEYQPAVYVYQKDYDGYLSWGLVSDNLAIQIFDTYIDDATDELVLTFKNTSSTLTRSLTIGLRWEVES